MTASPINRRCEEELKHLRNEFPILAIVGPRQSGKTTLAKKAFPGYTYVSLEDPDRREFARDDPRGFLGRYSQDVIIDEVQRVPPLMSYLQSHVDALGKMGSVVITGSHNFQLMERIGQSLAGRVGILTLLPLSWEEIGNPAMPLQEYIFTGSYPGIFDRGIRPRVFYRNYISTYVEKDVYQLREITNRDKFMRFIRIMAGRTGQELNTLAISDDCGISHTTVKQWLSVLEASYLVILLKPYHKNYNKRLTKRPKVYFTDTGLICSLLGIRNADEIDSHYLKGALFETMAVTEILKVNLNLGSPLNLYYWRDNHRREIDMIIDAGAGQYAIEMKAGGTVQQRYLNGLRYWTSLTGAPPEDTFLIYGGTETLTRNGFNLVSWNRIDETIIRKLFGSTVKRFGGNGV